MTYACCVWAQDTTSNARALNDSVVVLALAYRAVVGPDTGTRASIVLSPPDAQPNLVPGLLALTGARLRDSSQGRIAVTPTSDHLGGWEMKGNVSIATLRLPEIVGDSATVQVEIQASLPPLFLPGSTSGRERVGLIGYRVTLHRAASGWIVTAKKSVQVRDEINPL
ncbi:MAG TPA: hypothetical protein VMH39_11335 [Gemmatimonadaceae bacterium]|nr:hypothetical protein [Gemmatimonadaceae bacterium]